MTRYLTVLMVLILSTAAPADELMVSFVPPPIVRDVVFVAHPNLAAAPYFYGYQAPFIANHYFPATNYGYNYAFNSSFWTYPSFSSYMVGYNAVYDYRSFPWYDSRYTAADPINFFWTTEDKPVYRPATSLTLGQAQFRLDVPLDAEVWIEGAKTQQTGPVRTFVTPALTGPTAYEVKIRRTVAGNVVEHPMKVTVKPGDQASLHVFQ